MRDVSERRKHSPNQIPVPLMERIVLACTHKGDLVIDPFCGTGSSGVACAMYDRDYIGMDISDRCVREASNRLRMHQVAGTAPEEPAKKKGGTKRRK